MNFRAPQSVLDSASSVAAQIARLNIFVLALFLVVTVGMWALIAWAAFRRKGTLAEHAPVDVGGGQKAVFWGGFVFPAVVLAIVFALNLSVMQAVAPDHMQVMSAPDIRVVGHQWWWDLQYEMGSPQEHFHTANEIHIPTGRPVILEVVSADVIHSFWVPRLQGKVDLIPGQSNRITLYTDQPGEYSGQCAEYCGAQHAHMRLLVIAEPPDTFARWLARQRQPADPPDSGDAIRGQEVFQSAPCGLCHAIRGSDAHGSVGPDLTHLASRKRLAANSFELDEANLRAWVTHAQSLKPGVRMPNVTQFTGSQLGDLTGYLHTLQ